MPVVVLWRGFRPVDETTCGAGAIASVRRDDETRPRIAAALQRGRRLRAAGAAVGLWIAAIPAYLNLVAPERAGDFAGPVYGTAWLFGAALGATVAEIGFVQRPLDPREAALDQRRWQDYVGRAPVVGVAGCVALTCAAATVATIRETRRADDAVVLAVAALLVGLCLVAGLWRIARRPRLSLEPRWRIVDEALRADGANRLAGASVAIAGEAASFAVGEASWELFPLLSLLTGLIGWAAMLWWWSLSRDVIWRVDRLHAPA